MYFFLKLIQPITSSQLEPPPSLLKGGWELPKIESHGDYKTFCQKRGINLSSITFTMCLGKVRFPCITMQMGVSIAIMHVVFSAVNYAHNCLYCNYAGDSFIAMQVIVSSNNIMFLSLNDNFFLKLTRKHLKVLYQVCISQN